MIPTDWLRHRARNGPDRLAIRDQAGEQLTYAELLERAEAVATGLDGRQRLHPIELGAGLEHAVEANAAMLAGVPFQMLRPGLPDEERKSALSGTRAGDDRAPGDGRVAKGGRAAGEIRASAGDDTLCRVLTSGTSGARRPVELSYANHYCGAAASAFNLGVRADERWLCCIPLDHIGGLSILLRSLIYGTAAVLHERFDSDSVAAELEGDVTIVSLVATQLGRLLGAGAPLERPRLILVGGGPVPGEMLDEALGRGARVVQTYGLTEACSQVCTLSVADASRKRGSAGRPLPGLEVEVVAGEILVRGPTVAAASADDDGWLHTGDRGRFDQEGFLWVEGRFDDLIVTGGENVAPEEVEEVLRRHPAVSDVAVVGRPDPEWGSAVIAVVVPSTGATPTEAELIEHCRAVLAPFKLPKRIELTDQLPRSAAGKLLRRALR